MFLIERAGLKFQEWIKGLSLSNQPVTLIAHNVIFDKKVLEQNNSLHKIPVQFEYFCSGKIFKKALKIKGKEKWNLEEIANKLQVPKDHLKLHHAKDDV